MEAIDWPLIRPSLARRHAEELARLQETTALARVRFLRALDQLDALGRAFAADGIGWALVKGPGLALAAWPDPFARPFSDLDVFVSPARFGDAVVTLLRQGYRAAGVPDVSAVHWTFTRPGSFAVELHHAFSREFPVSFDLLERFCGDTVGVPAGAVAIPAGGGEVPVPAPAAHLAYVLLHAYNHGWQLGLSWALDVHFLLRGDPWLARAALAFFPRSWPVALSLRVAGLVVPGIRERAALAPPTPRERLLLAAIAAHLEHGGPGIAGSALCRMLASPAPAATLASMVARHR